MPEFDSTVEYRDIKGFPGYKVGNDGTVWSCKVSTGLGWRYGFRWSEGAWRRLKLNPTPSGRLLVCLCPGWKYRQVHRLVLEAFVGPCPPRMECCHDPDPNPTNNNLSNLRWDSHKANHQDSIKYGRQSHGEKHPCAKLTEDQVRKIRASFNANPVHGIQSQLARKHKVSVTVINRIVRGKTWRHLA